MNTNTMVGDSAANQVVELLEQELASYALLKTLAARQSDLMKVRDLDGLAKNTALWEDALTQVEHVRRGQQRLMAAWGGEAGGITSEGFDQFVQACGERTRLMLQQLRRRRNTEALALSRQNELNRRLARFCVDLLGDEIAIFKRGLQESGGGCYDDRGERQDHGAGGVVVHQA